MRPRALAVSLALLLAGLLGVGPGFAWQEGTLVNHAHNSTSGQGGVINNMTVTGSFTVANGSITATNVGAAPNTINNSSFTVQSVTMTVAGPFYTFGGSTMTIDNGRVAIGKAQAQGMLDVAGNMTFFGPGGLTAANLGCGASDSCVGLSANGANVTGYEFWQSNSRKGFIQIGATPNMVMQTLGSPGNISITAAGNMATNGAAGAGNFNEMRIGGTAQLRAADGGMTFFNPITSASSVTFSNPSLSVGGSTFSVTNGGVTITGSNSGTSGYRALNIVLPTQTATTQNKAFVMSDGVTSTIDFYTSSSSNTILSNIGLGMSVSNTTNPDLFINSSHHVTVANGNFGIGATPLEKFWYHASTNNNIVFPAGGTAYINAVNDADNANVELDVYGNPLVLNPNGNKVTVQGAMTVTAPTTVAGSSLTVTANISNVGFHETGTIDNPGPSVAGTVITQNVYWAKSVDGASQSSGCLVAMSISDGANNNLVFTSTTSQPTTLSAIMPGVLLETCAVGVKCRVGTSGIYHVQTSASVSGQFVGFSATRCKFSPNGPLDSSVIGYPLQAIGGAQWAWIRLTGAN